MLTSQLSCTVYHLGLSKMDFHQECEHQEIWGKTQEQAFGIRCSKKQYIINVAVYAWTRST